MKLQLFIHWIRHNASSAHERWMMRYLQKRGWVVFYLEPIHRDCRNGCWMALAERNHHATDR